MLRRILGKPLVSQPICCVYLAYVSAAQNLYGIFNIHLRPICAIFNFQEGRPLFKILKHILILLYQHERESNPSVCRIEHALQISIRPSDMKYALIIAEFADTLSINSMVRLIC